VFVRGLLEVMIGGTVIVISYPCQTVNEPWNVYCYFDRRAFAFGIVARARGAVSCHGSDKSDVPTAQVVSGVQR
jgi:hypothetical protein